jgi:hypothetical protein
MVDKFTIESGNYERTDIVPYLTEAFFVSYDNNMKVYGRLVTSDGDFLGSTVQLAASSAAVADWNNLATDGSDIFVAWEDTRIEYEELYDWLPDCFCNIWNLNIPDPSDITIVFGQEKELILQAQVTSKEIAPTNLDRWHQFLVSYDGSITFDILDGTGQTVIIQNAGNGEDLSGLTAYTSLKLRAHFTRTVPSSSPTINSWSVLYQGIDTEPPVTSVDHIDGTQGLNGWYTSECVTIWLAWMDYPEATGSGVNHTYYTIDSGQTQIYDDASGIHICSYQPNWYGSWMVNFWSVDYKGNTEVKTKPENYRSIKIDSKRPEVTITSPTEDQEVAIPFEVYATATDNAGVIRVDFDLDPYDTNPGCPWSDTVPPYIWTCNVPHPRTLETQPSAAGVLKHIKATAYDDSGQKWINEIWVRVTNWGKSREIVVIHDFNLILEKFMLGFAIDDKLKIEITKPESADSVKFIATKITTGKQITILDNDFSDGCSASFNLPTGLYKITNTNYKEGEEIASSLILRVFFVHR